MSRNRKSSVAPIKAGSQRRGDILKYCEVQLQSLAKLYETTDPAHGLVSEEGKLEAARQAISIWWYLWAELMLWAQSHLAGYEMLKSRPDLRLRLEERLGVNFSVDSHVVEYVGVYFSWNHVDDSDPMLSAIHEVMEEFEITMKDAPLRPTIRELLVSCSANSSFWRFPLQHALFALELGEVDDLVKPSQTRRQGNPVALYFWKLMALCHVHFLIGKGVKKYRALEDVARAIGQSVETLRSWEKAYGFDDDFMMSLRAAQMAGQLEEQLDTRAVKDIIEEHAQEYFRHTADIEYAKRKLGELRASPLNVVREGLKKARGAKNGS
ncbi:hypothetical protein NB311A_02692 [Nitrobacter sp. Nb-311A]|uniref:hypothetical protein n=1 Tax=Nitrobacter sp. Nb-311A TaxID=314253 RepID=UPI0000686836|nr:hypothetical protein [Nitrobacter sp. Nb-311A]EAQ33928.1 hypothetical protein NB311A_02692 [Nitrobacter sp. Nb-311A]